MNIIKLFVSLYLLIGLWATCLTASQPPLSFFNNLLIISGLISPPSTSPARDTLRHHPDIRNWCTSTIPDLNNFLSLEEKARARVTLLENMATNNNPEAQAELGCVLQHGLLGQAKDPAEALKLYTASAAQNHPLGQALLGQVFHLGSLGQAKDPANAFMLYTASAIQHHPLGQANLGAVIAHGLLGQAKNPAKAFELFKASAAQNHPLGQVALGYVFEYGLGQAKDQKKAFQLYTASAAQNHPLGQVYLGSVFEHGLLGQAKDPVKALKLYTDSAAQNHPVGRVSLGRVFENGLLGQEKNQAKALELYKGAYEDGSDVAKGEYERLKKMALTQLTTITPETTCSICHEKLFGTNEPMSITPCRHSFHQACLTNWTQQTCPICRRTFTRE